MPLSIFTPFSRRIMSTTSIAPITSAAPVASLSSNVFSKNAFLKTVSAASSRIAARSFLPALVPALALVLLFVCAAALVLVASTAIAPQRAAAQGNPAVRDRVVAGLDLMYSMKLADAAAVFDDLIAKYPEDPTGYYFRSSVFLYKNLFDYSEPDYKRFMVSCDRSIAVAEAALAKNPNDNYARTVIGAIYGFRAVANYRSENIVKGALDARSCYTYLNEVLKKDPKQWDAYLGMGIFHFGLGAIPKTFRYIANLGGLKGDRDLGLKEMQIAADKSLFSSTDAKTALAMIKVYYDKDYDGGLKYLNEMLKKYPNNIPTIYTIGNVQTFLRKQQFAIDTYKRIIQMADTNFKAFTTFSNYRMGEAYYRLNDFDKAMPAFQRYFRGRYERSFRAIAAFRLAVCYEFKGNRDEALKGYKKTLDFFPIEPEDKYAIRKAKEYLKAPIAADEVTLIKGVNCMESLRFDEGLQILRPLAANTAISKEIRGEALYYIGDGLRQQSKHDEAIASYQKAIELQCERERWVSPWAYFHISEIQYNTGKRDASKASLEKAKAYSDYDFQEGLSFMIERDITLLK
jgi:tetratricopeptide (TPR) repeat protein